ncbi:G1/S-specific cyclin-E2-like [Brachyistius frenatus]|uniref:G1/S-specific cyclin-E2-like n=1 Tax=Brachyistius frenatus TaxID=100188 RepID=UPI0037E77739
MVEGSSKPRILIDTPEKMATVNLDDSDNSATFILVPAALPHIGSSEKEWRAIIKQYKNYRHSKNFLKRHRSLEPQMRAILLDWLNEVSEAYILNRHTFYLAMDYFDRFMLSRTNIEKGKLQLIGITCLFIASKLEETCPPKLSEMAYVTADTYLEKEISDMELVILKELKWLLRPNTPLCWLTLYFQMASLRPPVTIADMMEPQYPQDAYIVMTRLLDLCMIHLNSLDFHYRLLSASVLCHYVPVEKVRRVSGLSKELLQPCLDWMVPLVDSMGRFDRATLKDFPRVRTEERHYIQTHADYLGMLDYASREVVNGQFSTSPKSKGGKKRQTLSCRRKT